MTRQSLDETYLRMAEVWAQRSKAVRKKVGALLVNPVSKRIISDGYNGMPAGTPEPDLCEIDPNTTDPLVLHAESNAILKCAKSDGSTEGSTLYVTLSPCVECSKLIIQAGIKRVVYREQYRIPDAIEILRRYGISVEHLPT